MKKIILPLISTHFLWSIYRSYNGFIVDFNNKTYYKQKNKFLILSNALLYSCPIMYPIIYYHLYNRFTNNYKLNRQSLFLFNDKEIFSEVYNLNENELKTAGFIHIK